jgi:hypothetical protein
VVDSKKEGHPPKRRRRSSPTRLPALLRKRPPTRADLLLALSDNTQDIELLTAQVLSEEVKRGKLGWVLAAIKSSDMSLAVKFVLLELLAGRLKRAKHRPPDPLTRFRIVERALRVLDLERNGWRKRDAAVAEAAAQLHCSTRSVEQALTDYEYLLRAADDVFIRQLRERN